MTHIFEKASRYPAEMDALMMDLWIQGESSGQIAFRMGLTRNAVIGRLSRLGAPKRNGNGPVVSRPRIPKPQPTKIERVIAHKQSTEIESDAYDAAPFLVDGKPYTTLSIPSFGACRWPLGEPSADMPFCGHMAMSGSSYCEHHFDRARGQAYPPRIREPKYG